MRLNKVLDEQDQKKSTDPVEQDQRIVQAQNEIKRIEDQLAQKKQMLFQLKARVSQDLARQQDKGLKIGTQQQNQAATTPDNQQQQK
jgi:hypothetical protein